MMPTSETGGTSTATEMVNLEMSTISGSSTQQSSIGGLIYVPDHLRKPDEAFTPRLMSIGPIHHANVKLQIMKKYKQEFFACFIRQANKDIELFKTTIRGKEKEIRSYYAETIVSSISSDDFVTMILVDGLFILEYFLIESNQSVVDTSHTPVIADWMRSILKFDLVLFENQLPFFVLEMLFDQASFPPELKSLMELAVEFFKCYNFQKLGDYYFHGTKIEHFTDLVRLFYLKEGVLPNRISGDFKLAYSATQLHEAGVKLKGVKFHEESGWFFDDEGFRRRFRGPSRLPRCFLVIKFLLQDAVDWLRGDDRWLRGDERMEGKRILYNTVMGRARRFLDIRFNNGVLEIPLIKLTYERIRLIRNIIAVEQSLYLGDAYVTDFFAILDFLINDSKDVDLLCDEGILVNYLGDSNLTALAVNSLNNDIFWDYMNADYSNICYELNAFCKKQWHRWRATLWGQYFSTPWRAASTSAAIILLVLTAIQTVCSLKSTKW